MQSSRKQPTQTRISSHRIEPHRTPKFFEHIPNLFVCLFVCWSACLFVCLLVCLLTRMLAHTLSSVGRPPRTGGCHVLDLHRHECQRAAGDHRERLFCRGKIRGGGGGGAVPGAVHREDDRCDVVSREECLEDALIMVMVLALDLPLARSRPLPDRILAPLVDRLLQVLVVHGRRRENSVWVVGVLDPKDTIKEGIHCSSSSSPGTTTEKQSRGYLHGANPWMGPGDLPVLEDFR
mmetsp:Transcript_17040/g.46843  ORF Transcript_17040/g.46843 Transcript_17040/m.46843 type:complete len:235 (-) Transcript_17040:150-854(-)